MRKLLVLLFLCTTVATQAADLKVTGMTEVTSPSDNSWMYVIDLGLSPSDRKYKFTNLVTKSSATVLKGDGTQASASDIAVAYGFNPTSYPGLYAHMIGDTLTNTYTAGQEVLTWAGTAPTAITSVTPNGPILKLGASGHYGAYFNTTNYVKFGGTAGVLNSNLTVFIALEQTNTTGFAFRYLLSGANSHLTLFNNANKTTLTAWHKDTGGLQSATNSTSIYGPAVATSSNMPTVLFYRYETGDSTYPKAYTLGMDKGSVSGTFTSPTNFWAYSTFTNIAVGNYSLGLTGSSTGWRGLVLEVLMYTNALSQAQCQEISEYLRLKYNVVTRSYVLMDGDSGFVGGAMGTSEKAYAPVFHQVFNTLKNPDGGITASTLRTAAQIIAAATNLSGGTLQANYFPTRTDHVYLLYYGTTGIATNTATNIWANTGAAMAAAKAQGYIVPVMTLLPAGTNDTERLLYNEIVRSQWQNVGDCLVDFQVLPFTTPSDYSNTTYYLNSSGTYLPSAWNSVQCSELLLRHLRNLCSTNLIFK